MSSIVVDSITIGIPFSLSWADAKKNPEATVLGASTFKRTFEVPNRSFVMELATDSLCSFTSDLLSNDASGMERVHTDSESTLVESHPSDGIPIEDVLREEESALSEWISYDLTVDGKSESTRRNASEYGFGSGSRSWRWTSSRSRDYSNPFHPCRLDSLEKGNSFKLASSPVSSYGAMTRCSMDSKKDADSIPWPPTGHAAISRPTINSSLNLSTVVAQKRHIRAASSLEKSSELDFWNNYDAIKEFGLDKTHVERSKRHKKWFLVKMLGCFCVQVHKRDGTYL